MARLFLASLVVLNAVLSLTTAQQGTVQGQPQQRRIIQGQPPQQRSTVQDQPPQQRRAGQGQPQQGDGQRRAQQRAVDGRAQQQNSASSALDILPDDILLYEITEKHIKAVFNSEDWINMFTACFINPKTCRNRSALNILKQMDDLGNLGECLTCTREQADYMGNMFAQFFSSFLTKYPKQWREVLPHLGRLWI